MFSDGDGLNWIWGECTVKDIDMDGYGTVSCS